MDEDSPPLLWARLLSNLRRHDASLLVSAYRLAQDAHREQWRDGSDTPYIVHPLRVALLLAEEVGRTQPALLATALLHDVLEDSDWTVPRLQAICGQQIAGWVALLTKPPAAPSERAARDERYFAALEGAPLDVRLVKCADRLDNLRSLRALDDPPRLRRYLAETRHFLLPLAASSDAYLHQQLAAHCADEPSG